MKRHRFLIFSAFIILELIIAGILGLRIFRKNNVKGVSVAIPLRKDQLVFGGSKNFPYFYELNPNAKGEDVNSWAALKASYTTNADGLNEKFDYSPEKPDDVFRIMTLGDSFTFGLFVDTPKNYPEQLEELLKNTCSKKKKFEVINLGIAGYDIQYTIERYKLRGQKYNPDLILWLLKDDDFLEIKDFVLPRQYEYDRQYAQLTEEERKKMTPAFTRAWEESIHRLGREYIVNKQKEFLEDFFGLYKGKTVFLSFAAIDKEFRRILSDFAKKKDNVFYHDNLVDIYSQKNTYFFDKHPTGKGYELIAEDMFNFLLEKNILICYEKKD